MIELILGGARSGKSSLAESRAIKTGLKKVYIATAQPLDQEMQARIDRHQFARSRDEWLTIEEPLKLAECIKRHAASDTCILVDCLTLWLSNLLCSEAERFGHEKQHLLSVLKQSPGTIICVTNETGMGVVPMGKLSRQFVDESGWLHQDIAKIADTVILTVAGLPHILKGQHDIPSGPQGVLQ